MAGDAENQPLLDEERQQQSDTESDMSPRLTWTQRNRWVVFAVASGACAAFNGVFAKLTTTELTSTFSQAIARLLHLSNVESVIEVIVRSIFFGLNLVFNGIMWTLFTKALAKGNSTTQVSIMNTSTNFMVTAILGFAIFSESLPPLWWLGAAMLVAGNVIIGRKDEGVPSKDNAVDAAVGDGGYAPVAQQPGLTPDDLDADKVDDEDILDLGDDLVR